MNIQNNFWVPGWTWKTQQFLGHCQIRRIQQYLRPLFWDDVNKIYAMHASTGNFSD